MTIIWTGMSEISPAPSQTPWTTRLHLIRCSYTLFPYSIKIRSLTEAMLQTEFILELGFMYSCRHSWIQFLGPDSFVLFYILISGASLHSLQVSFMKSL